MEPPEAESAAGLAMRQALRSAVGLPPTMQRVLFGAPPKNDRGAPLDEGTHALLSAMERAGRPRLEDLGAERARVVYRRANELFDVAGPALHSVERRSLPGPAGRLRATLFRPREGTLPVLLYFHGGGFVIGSTEEYRGFLSRLARATDVVVVGVDYRLAPEAPFPAALEDGVAAFRWVLENAGELGVDPEQVVIGGDSAGANLSAVVCQEQIEMGGVLPRRQLLIYPRTDTRGGYGSLKHFAEGYYLTAPTMKWFTECYLGPTRDREDPRVSPLLYPRKGELPETTVVTAGFDPLRDEGEAYARALREAGVSVRVQSFDRLVHGFITMGGVVPAAKIAVDDIAAGLHLDLSSIRTR